MIVFPMWMLKYILMIGGFVIFFEEGAFYGLAVGIVGLVWCIYNWKNHKR